MRCAVDFLPCFMSRATIMEARRLLNWGSGSTGRFSAALRRDMVDRSGENWGKGMERASVTPFAEVAAQRLVTLS
jgi:hypothetical protein